MFETTTFGPCILSSVNARVHLVFKSLSPEDAVSYKVMKAGIVVKYDIMPLSIALPKEKNVGSVYGSVRQNPRLPC